MINIRSNLAKLHLRPLLLKSLVVVFFGCLVLPNVSLFNETKNQDIVRKENRKLTPLPAFKPNNRNFYTQLENAYQDRLYKRDKLIYYWSKVNFDAGVILKKNLFMGKNKWLFDRYAAVRYFNQKEKIRRIKEIQDYCNAHGADFIFMAFPYKNAVYDDYVPDYIKSSYPPFKKFENELIDESKKLGINYVSLYFTMMKARDKFQNPLYWSDDHHWSYEGASVAADVVLKYIKSRRRDFVYDGMPFDGTYRRAYKEHSQINSLGLAQNGVTNVTQAPWSQKFTYQIFGVNADTGKEEIHFNKNNVPVSNAYLWSRLVKGEGIVINKDTPNKIKILSLNDSYGSYMATYITQYASYTILTHYSNHAGKKKNTNLKYLLERYKPDFVILSMGAPSFFHAGEKGFLKNISFEP